MSSAASTAPLGVGPSRAREHDDAIPAKCLSAHWKRSRRRSRRSSGKRPATRCGRVVRVSAHDPMTLPDALPEPVDDGAAAHLPGVRVPAVPLPATDGRTIRLDLPGEADRTVVYAYPR